MNKRPAAIHHQIFKKPRSLTDNNNEKNDLAQEIIDDLPENENENPCVEEFDYSRRKISKPRRLLSNLDEKPVVPHLGNLFAGLPRNPFQVLSPPESVQHVALLTLEQEPVPEAGPDLITDQTSEQVHEMVSEQASDTICQTTPEQVPLLESNISPKQDPTSNAPTSERASESYPKIAPTSDDEEEFNLNICGLNVCFIDTIQKLNKKNPTADFTKLFAQYSKHLSSFSHLKPKPSACPEIATASSVLVVPVNTITSSSAPYNIDPSLPI